jgi:putative ABC transport system permease protein
VVTWVLAVLALPLAALILHDLLRRPTIGRLALRNAGRRKGEVALVIAGSLLATAIITASFVVGDTLRASIRDGARTRLGPVDVVVEVPNLERFSGVAAHLTGPIPGVDGILRTVAAPAAVKRPGDDPRAEPRATLLEVDFDAARAFGGDERATGLAGAGPTPSGDQVVIARDLAGRLGVGAGDPVEVHAYGTRLDLRVRQVLPQLGLAGFGQPSVFVAPGTIARLAVAVEVSGATPPSGLVLLSNEGGVFGGARGTGATLEELAQRLGRQPIGIEVQPRKQDLLDRADAEAAAFTEVFAGIGAFSVIAGVLLLVNIFVMLADERKSELGMLRAVGMKRNHLVRTFGAEGGLYASVAALAGTVVGVGVGRVVVVVAERILNAGEDERAQVALRFTAEAGSLASGFVIGGVIALATVWAASLRIGRLNVIRAIHDLPEPGLATRRRAALVLGAGGVATGGLLLGVGLAAQHWFGSLLGPPLAALAAVPLLRRVASRRLAVSLACFAALAWGLLCVTLLPGVFEGSSIAVFVVQGLILVAAAVALGAANADLVGAALGRLGGARRSLPTRLAFAYPMARRFRTSMLLGMYALVVFVFTFLAVFSQLFRAQAPRFVEETRAGYDLIVDSNRANPATINLLLAQPELSAVAPIVRGFPRFATPVSPEPRTGPMSGFDRSFLERGLPALASRQDRFPSDRAAWEAVLDSTDLVVVADTFLQDGGGPPGRRVHLGDTVNAVNPRTVDSRRFTVAAILSSDFVNHGALVGAAVANEFLAAEGVPSRHFVAVRPGVDLEEAAARVTGRMVAYGADAESIESVIQGALAQQQGFIRLMQGYLALGLLVGIAGLGVVMVRAVRERRREIGMLRAMGFPRRVVRASFLLEAGFVAVEGVLFGVVLALVVSYQLLSNSNVFGEQALPFSVPWAALAAVMVAAVAASLAAAAAPATQAARIRPAVALRIPE